MVVNFDLLLNVDLWLLICVQTRFLQCRYMVFRFPFKRVAIVTWYTASLANIDAACNVCSWEIFCIILQKSSQLISACRRKKKYTLAHSELADKRQLHFGSTLVLNGSASWRVTQIQSLWKAMKPCGAKVIAPLSLTFWAQS